MKAFIIVLKKPKKTTQLCLCLLYLKYFNISQPNKPSLPITILYVAQSYEHNSLKLINWN